jgi:hypothetical protein
MLFETAVIDANLQPVLDITLPVFQKINLVIGGVFGIYLILLLARVHYERKKVRILQDIRYDLDQLNMSKGVTYSRQRHGVFRRSWDKTQRWWQRHFTRLKK